MGMSWTMRDLEEWDARIRDKVAEYELDCYDQEFEICDRDQMIGFMAYHGMPSHYPHWSFGKSYERQRTLNDLGVAGLPYEMVINSSPSIAYLMRDNSLCLQILTMAHVYGHNDFFKNNFYFARGTRAELILGQVKMHADRVRSYVEDPSIGLEAVEKVLDAAHALSFNIGRNPAVPRLSPAEQRARALDRATGTPDPYAAIHARKRPDEAATNADLERLPLDPDPDLLLFIRDHGAYLADWQRDLIGIVDEEARYFLPQMETKIMNEGWASFWHRAIMNTLGLPPDIHMEFLVRHNQVVRRIPGDVNPYCLGLAIWDRLVAEEEGPWDPRRGLPAAPAAATRQKLFQIRESERDASFLRRFLDEELMRDQDLFAYEPRGNDLVVAKVSNETGWREVRDRLIRQTGTNAMPMIRVLDGDYGRSRGLLLEHVHDGRDLQLGYAEKTLDHVYTLWGREVHLKTTVNRETVILSRGTDGFRTRVVRDE